MLTMEKKHLIINCEMGSVTRLITRGISFHQMTLYLQYGFCKEDNQYFHASCPAFYAEKSKRHAVFTNKLTKNLGQIPYLMEIKPTRIIKKMEALLCTETYLTNKRNFTNYYVDVGLRYN